MKNERTDRQLKFAVALSVLSSPKSQKLWEYLDSDCPEDVFRILQDKRRQTVQDFLLQVYPPDSLACADMIIERCRAQSIQIIDYWDEAYPALLKQISAPPVVFYMRGALVRKPALAIVGTRKADSRSISIAERISAELAERGFTIVSGLAMGIDRAAHQAALNVNGSTYGIMANGIDVLYPVMNRDVYSMINHSAHSALISEYPPGITAGKWTFVRRNRIISGLSLGTVIIKASARSGALITARHALEQNREVFVCPGYAFDETYVGSNRLIQDGAIPIHTTSDIISDLKAGGKIVTQKYSSFGKDAGDIESVELDSIDSTVLKLLEQGTVDADNLIRQIDGDTASVLNSLMKLELAGRIIRQGALVSLL